MRSDRAWLWRCLLLITWIGFWASSQALSETEVPLIEEGKPSLESAEAPTQLDPLLLDQASPRYRRLGAALRRDTVPRPWILVPDTFDVSGREYQLHILGYIKFDVMHDFERLGLTPHFVLPIV